MMTNQLINNSGFTKSSSSKRKKDKLNRYHPCVAEGLILLGK